MKQIFTIFTILAAVMLTSSCQKELPDAVKNIDVSQGGKTPSPTPEEKYVRASAESLSFTSPAGSLSFTISSNTSWSIKSDQDWCMVSSSSGSNNAALTVNVSENTSTYSRSATITISSTDAGSVKVSITQAGANPDLQLNKNDLSFTADAGSDSFTITSNTSWTITSDQDWCTVSTSSGSKNVTITVNVSENKSTSSRSSTITVIVGDMSQTIAVIQAGANATLQLSKSSMSFDSSCGTELFTITSNTDWTAESSQSWCTLSSSSGSGNGTVTVRVSENTSTDSRTATVIVKGGNDVQTIVITQAGDVYHEYLCYFLFDTQLHPIPCQLTSIISIPGHFCHIETRKERGIRHIKTIRNYDGSVEDVLLSTERENQDSCILGANNCIIIGISSYDNVLIAYEGQCSNCLEQYGGTSYPMSWQKGGTQLHCNKCDRTYDVNNGTVVSGDGRRLYRYMTAYDGHFIRVWN